MNVAIIGAGAAGLALLRHMSKKPKVFRPVAFEKNSVVGGLWVYNENPGKHTSVYNSVVTNLPKEIMAFPDFQFAPHRSSYFGHRRIKQYLQDYSQHFGLDKYIENNVKVETVEPVMTVEGQKWLLRMTRDSQPNSHIHQVFDAVVACSGRFSEEFIPALPGAEEFRGKIIHSRNYRNPNIFEGENVLCLGGLASGQDIAIDLSPHAKQVYLAHIKDHIKSELPVNVTQTTGVEKVTPEGVQLLDGQRIVLDSIIFCTGYKYDLSYLSPSCQVVNECGRITPLYKHLIHCKYPTLAIMSVPYMVMAFTLFYAQARFITAALDGSMVLPSEADMQAESHEDYMARIESGLPHRYAHYMDERQWDYYDDLARLAGFPDRPLVQRMIWERVFDVKASNLMSYQKRSFKVLGPNAFREYLNP